MKRVLALSISAIALTPVAAHAHIGAGDLHYHLTAFAHPFGGLDHLVIALLVGIYAAWLGGRALWALPTTFVAAMAVGIGLGAAGLVPPGVAIGIMLSMVLLGAMLAMGPSLRLAHILPAVAAAGVFHGLAHGSELAAGGAQLSVAAAALGGSRVLHALGISTLVLLDSNVRRLATIVSGAAAILAGVSLLLA